MKLFYLIFFVSLSSWAQLPDISFNGTNNWSTHPSISFTTTTNQASITSNGSNNVLTSITVNLTNAPTEFYLVADFMLQNVTFDVATIKNPFIVIRNQSGAVLYRYTMKDDLNFTWFKSGIKISNYTDSQITIEFGINKANGTMLVKNPILTATAPTFVYEFPFSIPANVETTLNVDLNQKHNFENDLLSSNTHFVFARIPWSDANLQSAITNYFPMTNLRFPGGSVGNYYNYQTDNFFINATTSPNLINFNNLGNVLDYPGYNAFTTSSGATSTYMLNIMFNDVLNSKNEYLNRYNSGLPIKWVELGNELYLNENQVGPYVSNIASYISHSQQIVSEIKAVNPNAKLAVCLEKDDFNVGEWNHILSQNQTYFDAATLHNYIAINHHFYSKYVSYGMLSSYKTSLNRFNQYNQLFPSKPLLLTEWGITGNVDQPYFLETIGIADAFLAIEKANELNIVKQAGIHMLYKNNANSSPTLMYYDNSNNLRLTSKGVLYSKLFEVFKNAEVYNAETISAELSAGLKSVNAKMVKNGNQFKIFAVNKLPVDSPFHLEVDGNIFNGNYTIETLVDDMSNPTNGFLAASNSWSNSNGSGLIILPASSISIINIDEGEIQNLNSNTFSSSSLNVFPNPTSNVLQLYDENNSKDLRVSLFDVSGKLIDENLFKNQKSISIESLEKGLYFLKIYKNEILVAIKKVIKN